MRGYFSYAFWGLLLVFLDFRINGFDLLPDALGWAIAAHGALRLTPFSTSFFTAGALGWLLAVVELVSIVAVNTLLGYVATGLSCCFIWTFLGGIREIATISQRPALAQYADTLRKSYVAIVSAGVLLGLVFHDSNNGFATALAIPLAIAGFVVMLLALHLIYRAGRELPI
jgi:hypothetical protein